MYKQRLFGFALVAAAVLALATPGKSQAWGWGGFGGGWYGAYGYGYPGYYSYGYPGYSFYGPGYGYSYGYSPYSFYGYPRYYSYSYPSTFYGSSYSYPAANSYVAAPQSGQYQSFYYSPDADQQSNRRVRVEVQVPADAEVWFDNFKTQQTGTDRFFVSAPVEPNYNYTYDIKARWTDNGRPIERTKKVSGQPGQQLRVDFRNEQTGQSQTEERRQVTPPAPRERPETTPAPEGDRRPDLNPNQNQNQKPNTPPER